MNTRTRRNVSASLKIYPATSGPSVARIFFLLGISLFLLALGLTGAAQTAQAQGGERRSRPNRGLVYTGLQLSRRANCRPGFDIATPNLKRPLCTHGPDPAPRGTNVHVSVAPVAAASAAAQVTCDGDGSSGKRVQVVYARAADMPDRYDAYLSSIQQWAAGVDAIFSASALETGSDRHVRYVHDAACQPVVANVVLPPAGDDSFGNTILALQDLGYARDDRKYMVFVDATVYCGIATTAADDLADAANIHNSGQFYTRVDAGCWNDPTAAHELMHTMGGVQLSAPHSSGNFHCVDESDRMCYKDGAGVVLQYLCDTPEELRFDCNHDDYFNTNAAAGSYLATHWNPANDEFLIGAPVVKPKLLKVDALVTGSLNKRGQFSLSDTFKQGDKVLIRGHVQDQDGLGLPGVSLTLWVIRPNHTSVCASNLASDAKGNVSAACQLGSKAPIGQWLVLIMQIAKEDYAIDPASIGQHPFTVRRK